MNYYDRLKEIESSEAKLSDISTGHLLTGMIEFFLSLVLGTAVFIISSNGVYTLIPISVGVVPFAYHFVKADQITKKAMELRLEKKNLDKEVANNKGRNEVLSKVNKLSLRELELLREVLLNEQLVTISKEVIDNDIVEVIINSDNNLQKEANKDIYEIEDIKDNNLMEEINSLEVASVKGDLEATYRKIRRR